MNYLIAFMVPIGGFFWATAYFLIILKGIKDKAHGMPLIAMALNFTWEFIHVFIYPSNGISLYLNFTWFLLDLGIAFTYFKYSYNFFHLFYAIRKPHWLILSLSVFLIGFMLNLYGEQFFSQLQNIITKDFIFAEVLVGFIVYLFVPACMVAMLFQRKNSRGQSFLIAFSFTISIICYVIEILFNPYHHQWGNSFMMMLMATCIIIQVYYAILIFNQMKKEGKNPWSVL
ncbi:hypothetical protein I5M32_02395 [Pedobacter sp. SD-b]|uniref:Histidine kinase N-terminal 7TM region domain-containing protein n=1 Tax=Pedobacter segetis TaxID=2793069 RepID=A0ABS1BG23_9SPHI|nr:hypothetical protein [Pedobacter segetis]MBK0381798.1 hypothetical protein [Pedobacter segetis]